MALSYSDHILWAPHTKRCVIAYNLDTKYPASYMKYDQYVEDQSVKKMEVRCMNTNEYRCYQRISFAHNDGRFSFDDIHCSETQNRN